MNKVSYKTKLFTKQQGMTFIEVIIALVIIVIGILGAVALQATAKKSSFDAMQRSLASSLAQDMIARLRANNVANLVDYARDDYGVALNVPPVVDCNVANAPCSASQIVIHDIYEWERALVGGDVTDNGNAAGGIVDGRGCIFRNGNAMTVVVSWQGRDAISDNANNERCGAAGSKRRQVVVQAFII
ncbi:MAG TPA: type IV pilus modification protein PilV [Colwellia sp.]|mgnify:CR=1 FL=1|nr:type IV pilus modification protein PilV [Colwellia sp.]|tara:strand:+ start:2615 stop:3175 length:561 start_codon:yes stop_codon:yes gene_type:complete